VRYQYQKYSLPKRSRKPWEPHEDALLRKMHMAFTADRIAANLENRTLAAVHRRIQDLGLDLKLRPWTKHDDETLIWFFDKEDRAALAKRLNRTPNALRMRATLLGISAYRWRNLDNCLTPDEVQGVCK
jgi:hypothetical protein